MNKRMYGKNLLNDLRKAQRFYPHVHNTIGFFICLISKSTWLDLFGIIPPCVGIVDALEKGGSFIKQYWTKFKF